MTGVGGLARRLRPLAVAILALFAWAPVRADEVTILPAPASGALMLVRTDDRDPVIALGGEAGWFVLQLYQGRPTLAQRPGYRPPAEEPLPADALPMSRAVTGTRDIRRAWLAVPTTRYPHGVLGDRLEAAALHVESRNGRHLEYRLPEDAVFEDLAPRLADLGGDGHDSVLIVRSTMAAGSALAAYRLGPAGIEEQAVTEPIGTPLRWLNPVGSGDFDGDGRPDVAVVWHPHIGGVLRVYTVDGRNFIETGWRSGFSNHDIGTTELALHAVGDFDGDGVTDLAVRGADRHSLVLLSFRGSVLRTVATYRHPVAIAGPVLALDLDGNRSADLVYRLSDGSLAVALR